MHSRHLPRKGEQALFEQIAAERLSRALRDPDDALHELALSLRSLAGESVEPLRVTRWRGGIASESRAHHPFQPEVTTSTVAQIGSRLLFRGYGVGERSLALEAGLERALLIGPQRPAGRAQLLERHRGALFDRTPANPPLVCVATQTFEVGLDADVEALVTQSASASAIVQRLGRLNRAGVGRGRATIVRDTQSPLYAEDEQRAWQWLGSLARADGMIDVSVTALLDDDTRPTPARTPAAAGLTPEVIELLVQTAPRPERMADPDVEVFLRGPEEQTSTDVGLCWRCDLRIDDDSSSGRSYRQALLRIVPPTPEEIVTVSIARAHALLRAPRTQLAALGKAGLDTPDLEGGDSEVVPADMTSGREDPGAPARLVVLRGREQFEITLDGSGDPKQDLGLRDVRPGDVLVLPAAAGGYANGALAPASRRPVEDIACDIRAATDATVSPVAVRLTDEALNAAGLHPGQILRQAWRCEAAGTGVGLDELCELLGQAGERLRALGAFELRRVTDDAEPLGDLDVADLYEDSPDFFEDPDQEGLEGERPLFEEEALAERSAFVLLTRARITREELRPPGERPPTLQDHANAVAERAAGYLTRSGLPDPVAAAVVLAARVHDHGKADPRFQSFFRGGVTAFLETPIAKSVFGTADAQASRAARAAAGLPRGLRHEIASVAALADALEGWDQGARTVATDHTAPA